MQRASIRFPESTLARIDQLVEADEYPNRSQFVREAVRDALPDEQKITEV